MPREQASEFNAAKAVRSSERSLSLGPQPARERGVEGAKISQDIEMKVEEVSPQQLADIKILLSAGEKECGRE